MSRLRELWHRLAVVSRVAAAGALLGGSLAVAGALASSSPAAAASSPSWPSGLYMGVLSNVPYTIPIAVSGGTPLTSMSVNSAPAQTSGFALTNINLAAGTADMVGTFTGSSPGTSTTAKITATNTAGSSTGSFNIQSYTCSWSSSTGTTTEFDANQDQYVTGSESSYGAPITNGVTPGTTKLSPTCSGLNVPSLGAGVIVIANPFAGVITPSNNDNASSEADMPLNYGQVEIGGSSNYSYPSGTGITVPSTWSNGGTFSLSIGSQSDEGDTDTSLATCPPSQAAVNAGLVECGIVASTGSSSTSWNYSQDGFLYNGQNLPQQPTATLSSGLVSAGSSVSVTGGSNWWGNWAGAPVTGQGTTQSGSYYSVPAPGVYIGTSRATAVPASSSSVQISSGSYACGQASSSNPPNPCTFTPPAISGSFTVPAGLAPGTYNVYIDESNTTPLVGNGPNDSYQTMRGTNLGTAESVTQLTVGQAPAITSASSATFTAGSPGSFTVTTTGNPTSSISETGSLPSGVTLTDNGDGTATLAGTPAPGTGGSYPITIRATNGVSPDSTQSFTLTVDQAPAITSASSATFTAGSPGSFTVTTTGNPTSSVSETGALPSGVSFVDNGDGTATLSGTPAPGSGGSYPITIDASNGVSPDASQSFTLTVSQAPAITSASSATFTAGSPGSFTVTATGNPTPSISETGSLPSGVTFTDNGDGTATLSGTPAPSSSNSYPITIHASNGVSPSASQGFTLTVDHAPSITSASSTTFKEHSAGSFTVTTTGNPTAAITESGPLPSGVTLTDNGNGTATLAGTPALGTAGTYPITIRASNGVSPDATQSFTLVVNPSGAPLITSASSTSFTEEAVGSFTVTATGTPTPSITESGPLPSGVTLTDNGNGTATLAGTPALGTAGTYPITIRASNGVSPDATQSFTLTVSSALQAPAITSSSSTAFNEGVANSFTVATTGNPTASIAETGALPAGVTFVDNGNGTATLSGIPASGTGGTYPMTITASNGVSPDATQSFTLTVDEPPVITSRCPSQAVEGSNYTCTVTTTGVPEPSLSATGGPPGISFVDNGDGTGTLSGTPTATGSYPVTITATNVGANRVANHATQSFTITVPTPPAVTSVKPAYGSPAGGTQVTIAGTGLAGATAVFFGSTPATSFTVNRAGTKVIAHSPAGSGVVDVTVQGPAGTSPASPADKFSYLPAVTKLSPSQGPSGALVHIVGSNLAGATAVDFGGTPAASFTVVSGSKITAVAPAGKGAVDVTVTTPGGTSQTSPGDVYTYEPPTVTRISPTSGPDAGGTKVTIVGTDLLGATAVDFGGTPAASFSVVSTSKIVAYSPPGTTGTVDLSVVTPAGTSATGPADQFTYP